MELVVAGLSHHTAPLALREQVALRPEELPQALDGLVTVGGLQEALLLSTCNRTEIYGRLGDGMEAHHPIAALERLRPGAEGSFRRHGYVHGGEQAIGHLFRVAAGLDSLVLGEPQISGQVSRAYSLACSSGTAGPLLHRVVPRALQIGRRVRTETAIARGIASVAGAAIGLAERTFRNLAACSVVGIGAGQTVENALRALHAKGTRRIVVANRTIERAERLAADLGGSAASLDDVARHAADADIVVAATDAPEPLLRDADVAPLLRRRGARPLLVLDLGVPRDVDPRLGDRGGVYVYTLDDLQGIADRGRRERAADIPRAEAIVTSAVTEFRRRRRMLETAPAMRALLDGLLTMRSDLIESERGLSDDERAAAERMTGHFVDRLMRRLAPRLKDGTIPPHTLLDTLGIERPHDPEDAEETP